MGNWIWLDGAYESARSRCMPCSIAVVSRVDGVLQQKHRQFCSNITIDDLDAGG